jgi:hypothetical protein
MISGLLKEMRHFTVTPIYSSLMYRLLHAFLELFSHQRRMDGLRTSHLSGHMRRRLFRLYKKRIMRLLVRE